MAILLSNQSHNKERNISVSHRVSVIDMFMATVSTLPQLICVHKSYLLNNYNYSEQ